MSVSLPGQPHDDDGDGDNDDDDTGAVRKMLV